MVGGSGITWGQFIWGNLFPSLFGNVCGGAICLALTYSLAFGSLGQRIADAVSSVFTAGRGAAAAVVAASKAAEAAAAATAASKAAEAAAAAAARAGDGANEGMEHAVSAGGNGAPAAAAGANGKGAQDVVYSFN
jgi:hypothetical protein